MLFLFGKFFALSITTTKVPISGPSTVMSLKMPAAWAADLDAMMAAVLGAPSRVSEYSYLGVLKVVCVSLW